MSISPGREHKWSWPLLPLFLCPLWLCSLERALTPVEVRWIAGAACLLAVLEPQVVALFSRTPWLSRSFAMVFGIGVGWFLLRQSHEAKFWIIDDHEIADALGGGRVRSLGGFWQIISTHVEILNPTEKWVRYRPSYYLIHYFECVLWGLDPKRWYLARTLMLGVAAASTFYALLGLAGPLLASLTVIWLLTPPFWTDVWGRLGPAEQYATIGTAVFAASAVSILRTLIPKEYKEKPVRLPWVLAALGGIVAAGSKENFLFLPAFLVALFVLALVRKRASVVALLSTLSSLLFAVWVFRVVSNGIHHTGRTVYGDSPKISNASDLIARALVEFWDGVGLYALAVAAMVVGGAVYQRTFRRAGWLLFVLVSVIAVPLAVYASQLLFYKGALPAGMRYDFPALILIPLTMALIAALARKAVLETWKWPLFSLAFNSAFAVALTIAIAQAGFAPLKGGLAGNVERTRAFTQSLDRVVEVAKAHPHRPFHFVIHHEASYEPIVSVRTFMRARGLKNRVFLTVAGDAQSETMTMLRSWAEKGRSDWGHRWPDPPKTPWMFEPINKLPTKRPPFGVGFMRPPLEGTVPIASF